KYPKIFDPPNGRTDELSHEMMTRYVLSLPPPEISIFHFLVSPMEDPVSREVTPRLILYPTSTSKESHNSNSAPAN
ncbi:hypothetical protein HAX54_034743, partial [Datura stramonium]|nr:hypothetical protein [Datura stramonium]